MFILIYFSSQTDAEKLLIYARLGDIINLNTDAFCGFRLINI